MPMALQDEAVLHPNEWLSSTQCIMEKIIKFRFNELCIIFETVNKNSGNITLIVKPVFNHFYQILWLVNIVLSKVTHLL